ncbi:MAG: DUF1835 domain-containing protein [Lentisphaeria bacterium]|nr:DUF1835 domain-containing protein [Lentisphaeria bacterium]
MDGTELHILNGDQALELWKQCGFHAQSLVWRETYLEGPLPDTDDLEFFRNARAEYLSHFDELAGIDKSRLYRHLLKMDEAVLLLPENVTLMLWFDSCMFDQTILMRILSLLDRKNAARNVFLYCCDGNCLEKADFMRGDSGKVQLQPHDWQVAGEAWHLFIRKDADGIMRLLEREPFGRLPKMRKALLRYIDEIPDRKGLSRTQRQILELVAGGRHTFMEIFKGLDDFEEYPF